MAGTTTAQAYEPRYIRFDPNDNVAIVVNDLGCQQRPAFPAVAPLEGPDRLRCRPLRHRRSVDRNGWDLFRLILDVASGRTKVRSDRWGILNDLALFTPGPVT